MTEDRGIYTIPQTYVERMCMLMPVYYKIFRAEADLNAYQASVLFTMLQVDPYNNGLFSKSISHTNPMAYTTIRGNIKQLIEKGYLNVEGRKNYITVKGMEAIQRIITRLNNYRGEIIPQTDVAGNWLERKKERKDKNIQILATKEGLVREALAVIEAKKRKDSPTAPENATFKEGDIIY